MLENWITPTTETHTLDVKLTGLSPKDLLFLKTVIAIYADPENKMILNAVRAGEFAFQCHPKDGSAHVIDLKVEPPPLPPAQMIEFLARFNDAEWGLLKSRKKELFRHFNRGLEDAEKFVLNVLGHLPKRVKIKICSE